MNTTSSQVVHDILSQAYMRTVYTASVRHIDILGSMLYDLMPAAQEDFEYPEHEARAASAENWFVCVSCGRMASEGHMWSGGFRCNQCIESDNDLRFSTEPFQRPDWDGSASDY